MTVGTTERVAAYTANGVTTEFAVPFQFFEISVYLGSILVDPTEYVVNQTAPGLAGSVTFLVAPTNGTRVRLYSNTTVSQEVDYVDNDAFPAETHERALDRLTMAILDQRRDLNNVSSVDWLAYPDRLVTVNEDGAFTPLDTSEPGYVWVAADGTVVVSPELTDAPTTIASTTQALQAMMLRIGDPVLSMSPTPAPGRIRLTQTNQTVNKADWPELWTVVEDWGAPWGSTSTTFDLPTAAGYFLRFAATDATIDPDGPRLAGSTQLDMIKAHFHSGATDPDGTHNHGYLDGRNSGSSAGSGVNSNSSNSISDAGRETDPEGTHSHEFETDETGGEETRPKSVAYHLDVIASSQISAASFGSFGFAYTFDSGTSASGLSPGYVRLNNATLGSVTALYVHRTDGWGVNIGGVLDEIEIGQIIRLSRIGAQNNTLVVKVTASISTASSVTTIPVEVRASGGSFSGSTLALELSGPSGDVTPELVALVDTATAAATTASGAATTASTAAANASASASSASSSASSASSSASTSSTAATNAASSASAAATSATNAATSATSAASSASAASTSATAAAASATAAANSAAALQGTSTTSNSIGAGAKTFTTQAGKQWTAGQTLVITDDAAPSTNYMIGTVTSYSSTSLVMDITTTGGSGTISAWTINVSGVRGLQGPAGSLDVGALSGVTPASDDKIVIGDTSNSNATAYVTPAQLPISTAAQTALDAKLSLSGGTMSGDITLAGDPSSSLHPATKQYVDNLLAGLDPKASVKCATTANITLSGEQTIDGVTTSASRVLVKNQSTASQNGIYVSGAGSWTRATDADSWTELVGALVTAEEGSTNGDSGWICNVDSGGTLGSTSVTWVQFLGTGAYQARSDLLTAIAALSMVADRYIYGTGTNTVALGTITSFGRSLIDDADASAARTTLGLGTAATLTQAQAQQEVICVAVSDETTSITTGTAKVTFRMPFAMTLTAVRASLSTASSSGIPAIDINEAGASILSTVLTIDANEKTSTTAATAAVISDSSLADDAEITIDIDTAGTGAKGLKVYLIGNRT